MASNKKWRVELTISGIPASDDNEYQERLSKIESAIRELDYDYEIDFGVGEEDL